MSLTQSPINRINFLMLKPLWMYRSDKLSFTSIREAAWALLLMNATSPRLIKFRRQFRSLFRARANKFREDSVHTLRDLLKHNFLKPIAIVMITLAVLACVSPIA